MLDLPKLTKNQRYAELDKDMVEDTLNLAERIAVDLFYKSNADGDKTGVRHNSETGEVKVPDSFHKGFKAFVEAGFHTLLFPPEEGGMGMPNTIFNSCQEYFNAGNTALGMYCSSITGTAHLLITYGSEEIKKTFLPKMLAGEWAGTMCLTEPMAGTGRRSAQDEGGPAKRWDLPHFRTENLYQLRRTRFDPEHHPTPSWPESRGSPGDQGNLDLCRPKVLVK